MKKLKNIVALLMSMAILCTTAACGGGGNGSSKTVVLVTAFETGYGTQWMKDAEVAFEAKYAETSFEEGKTGVDIRYDFTKSTNVAAIATSGTDVYFSSDGALPKVLADGGSVANINDWVTEKYDVRNGEPISIADKIYDDYEPALKGSDGNFYALPQDSGMSGLVYDGELFDKENLYIADPLSHNVNTADDVEEYKAFGETVNFIAHKNAKKSCGADGVYGTYDDGMPTSLTELLVLCHKIKNQKNTTPFTMTGENPGYCLELFGGLKGSLRTKEEALAGIEYEGTVRYVDGYSDENLFEGVDYIKKPIVKTAEIDIEKGDLLTKRVARYYALAFFEIAYREGWLSKDSTTGTVSHTDAQGNFICSGLNGKEKCAMLIEGSYWWTEAVENNKVDYYETLKGTRERDVRWMPLPVTIDQEILEPEDGVKRIFTVGAGNKNVIVNARTEKKPGTFKAVKAFIQMIYSDEWLSYYSGSTGTYKKGMDYEVREEDKAKLSSYHKTALEMMTDKVGTEWIYKISSKETYFNVYNEFYKFDYFPQVGNVYYSDTAFGAFKDGHGTQAIFNACVWSNSRWMGFVVD